MVYNFDCQAGHLDLRGLFWVELDKSKTIQKPMGAVTRGFFGLVYVWGICVKNILAFQSVKLIGIGLVCHTLSVLYPYFYSQSFIPYQPPLSFNPPNMHFRNYYDNKIKHLYARKNHLTTLNL